MRIRELILEYNAEITLKKQGDKLSTVAGRFNMTPEQLLKDLEEIDPTTNKQYVMWLIREIFKEKFRPEDSPRIRQALMDFEKLKPRLAKKDINLYDLHELEKTIDDILKPELGRDDTVLGQSFPVVDDSRVLYNGPLGQLAIPETQEASCELGKGTRWCTAGSNSHFDGYNKEGNLYIWRDRNGKKYQFHFETIQIKNARDQNLSTEEKKYFRLEHPVLKKLFQAKEKEILKQPANKIMEYIKAMIEGPWPEAEEIISDHPDSAVDYARVILGKRWRKAEEKILTKPRLAYIYARDVIKGPWPEAEEIISDHPDLAIDYAIRFLGKRLRKAEEKILTGPTWSLKYARDVIKGRWPEAEHLFIDNPYWASEYAIQVLKKRWPEAEETIKKDPREFLNYSKRFLR